MWLCGKLFDSFLHPFIHTNKHGISNMCKVLCSTKVTLIKAQTKDGRTHIFEKYILKIKEHEKQIAEIYKNIYRKTQDELRH